MHRPPVRASRQSPTHSHARLPGRLAFAATLAVVLAACTPDHSPGARSSAGSLSPDDVSSATDGATSKSPATAPSSTAPHTNTVPSASAVPSTIAASVAPTLFASENSTVAPSATVPRFTSTATLVTAAQLGASWHAGCPVGPAQLRQISLKYWGFDGSPHTGTIVVNASVVTSVTKVFATLYAERFPIRRMEPVSNFGGSDDASMAADNTSGFNCRNAVAQGPPSWSAHAYGKAIDVNTIENPYLEGGKVLPPNGAPYAKRTPYRPGMAVDGGQLVTAFAAVGWLWGGRWTDSPDYQHFSSTGG